MTKHFWPEQTEKVRQYVAGTDRIVALAYEAWIDCDCVLVFDTMAEYEQYKAENFKSIYSGWITLDHNFLEVKGE